MFTNISKFGTLVLQQIPATFVTQMFVVSQNSCFNKFRAAGTGGSFPTVAKGSKNAHFVKCLLSRQLDQMVL